MNIRSNEQIGARGRPWPGGQADGDDLGMSPEIGQRLLGGQQGGGPFMGRDLPGDFRDFSEDFGEKNSNFP